MDDNWTPYPQVQDGHQAHFVDGDARVHAVIWPDPTANSAEDREDGDAVLYQLRLEGSGVGAGEYVASIGPSMDIEALKQAAVAQAYSYVNRQAVDRDTEAQDRNDLLERVHKAEKFRATVAAITNQELNLLWGAVQNGIVNQQVPQDEKLQILDQLFRNAASMIQSGTSRVRVNGDEQAPAQPGPVRPRTM